MGIDTTDTGRRDFKVQQKMIAARPVYEIFDEQTGEKIAQAKQTWLSFLRSTMHIEDNQGNRLMTAKGGFFDKTFWLLDENGQKIARLTRPWIAFRKSFEIFYRDDIIKAQGGWMAWGFEAISATGHYAFKLDKQILALRDTFRVSTGSYMDPLHAVVAGLVIDRIFFKGSGCGCRCLLICLCPIIIIILTVIMLLPLLIP